jgi:hypothetical protein
MVAQHLAQCRVQQVGGRMVPHDRPPPGRVDRQLDGVAGAQGTLGDLHVVEVMTADVLGVGDHGGQAGRGDPAGVADLAASLGIARSLVEYRQAALARGEHAGRPGRPGQGDHRPAEVRV